MPTPHNLIDVVNLLLAIINPLIVILAALSLLGFFWGLTIFIFKPGDTKAHDEGVSLMKRGLIAGFVLLSLLGIIQLLYASFGFSGFGLPLLHF